MTILWYPEIGECPICGESPHLVRTYTSERNVITLCFACWNANQDGCIISSKDWEENVAFEFFIETETVKNGKTREFSWLGGLQTFI